MDVPIDQESAVRRRGRRAAGRDGWRCPTRPSTSLRVGSQSKRAGQFSLGALKGERVIGSDAMIAHSRQFFSQPAGWTPSYAYEHRV
jgi:hypothetical protein